MTPQEHALTLISMLHPNPGAVALIEITGLAPKTKPVKDYYFHADLAAARALELNVAGYSAFVNLNPRKAMSGFEHDVPYVTCFGLDVQPERIPLAEALRLLDVAGLPPTATAVSGNGGHFYFIVKPAEIHAAKRVWERLCKWTTSDAVFNVNRIFRCAGTVNWKPPAPRWCYLTGVWPERVYTIEHIESRLNAVGAPPARTAKEGIPVPVDPPEDLIELRKRLSPGVLDILATGERNMFSERQVTRSEADFVVVCGLINAGCSDAMIEWVYETQPVGLMKYREAGARYLRQTIDAARRATAAPKPPSVSARSSYYPMFTGGARDGGRSRALNNMYR